MSTTTSFPVGMLLHKSYRGIDCIDDASSVKGLEIDSLQSHFERPWDTDAHFCCYHTDPDDDDVEHSWPRINQPALSELLSSGIQVWCSFFAIDFDNPAHAPMDQDMFEYWLDFAYTLEGIASNWACFYTTKGGCRLVYVFEKKLPVLTAEKKVRGIHKIIREQGYDPDAKAAEWNRLFRAPKVTRDGVPSWDSEYFVMEWQDLTINTDDLESIEGSDHGHRAAKAPRQKHGDVPDFTETRKLIETLNNTGNVVMTEWYKWAKKRLRQRECYDPLFNGAIMAMPGDRNSTLLSMVGQATTMLYGHMGTSTRHIFALFEDAVSEFDPDEDWESLLWSMITRMWDAEVSDRGRIESLQQDLQMSKEDRFSAMAEGMREWCTHPALEQSANYEAKKAFLSRHSIVSCGNYYAVIRPDGYYEKLFVTSQGLIPRIIVAGMDDIIPTKLMDDRSGEQKDRSKDSIINSHTTPVSEIRVVPQIKGGYIQNIDTDHPVLHLPGYRRTTKLIPTYNEEVDTWLALLAGDHYDNLNKWIAFALDFEAGPICALSISGDPGTGKKMLAEGLAECLEMPYLADDDDVVGERQSGFLKTPFCLIDEGLPKKRYQDISSVFRKLVSGNTLSVREIYKPNMQLLNPVRLLLTANNDDVVQELSGGKDLTPNDRAAIAERLYHFRCNKDARSYLHELGGLAYTGKEGQRWIRADGSGRSDYIVAKHFLYIHANRKRFKPGMRLLMEGNAASNSTIMHQMRTYGGNAPLVIETLLMMIEKQFGTQRGLHVTQGGRVYVLAKAIHDYFRNFVSDKTSRDLGLRSIDKVLRNLTCSEPEEAILEGQEDEGRRLWHELDIAALIRTAEKDGHECKKLREINQKRKR